MKWLHISDIHNITKNYSNVELLDSFKCEFLDSNFNNIEALFITGDIGNQGYIDNNNTKIFIIKLCENLNIDKKNVFIVPGNHDLERNKDKLFDEIIRDVKTSSNASVHITNRMSPSTMNSFLGQQEKYHEFYKYFFETEIPNKLHYHIETLNVNIVLLNTAWFCQYKESSVENSIVINIDEVSKVLEKIDKFKPTIVLGHHSLELFDKNEKMRILSLFKKYEIKIYLCGHAHKINIRDYENVTEYVSGSFKIHTENEAYICVGNFSRENLVINYYELNNQYRWSKTDVERVTIVKDGTDTRTFNTIDKDNNKYIYSQSKSNTKIYDREISEIESINDRNSLLTFHFNSFVKSQQLLTNIEINNYVSEILICSLLLGFEIENNELFEKDCFAILSDTISSSINDKMLLKKLVANILELNRSDSQNKNFSEELLDLFNFISNVHKYENRHILTTVIKYILLESNEKFSYLVLNIQKSIQYQNLFKKNIVSKLTDFYNKFWLEANIFKNFANNSIELDRNLSSIKNINVFIPEFISGLLFAFNINSNLFDFNKIQMNEEKKNIFYFGNSDRALEILKYQLDFFSLKYDNEINNGNDLIYEIVTSSQIVKYNLYINCIDITEIDKILELFENNDLNNTIYCFNLPFDRLVKQVKEYERFEINENVCKDIIDSIVLKFDSIESEKQFEKIQNEYSNYSLFKLKLDLSQYNPIKKIHLLNEEKNLFLNNDFTVVFEKLLVDINENDWILDIVYLMSIGIESLTNVTILQNYLAFHKIDKKRINLICIVEKMNYLFVLKNDNLSLVNSEIMEYLEKNIISNSDKINIFTNFVNWISENYQSLNVEDHIKIIAKRLDENDFSSVRFADFENSCTSLLSKLSENKNSDIIFSISLIFEHNKLIDLFEKFLKEATILNNSDAIFYYVVNCLEKRPERENLLDLLEVIKPNLEANHIKSHILYAQICDSLDMELDVYRKNLETAIDFGSDTAEVVLASLLIKNNIDNLDAEEILKKHVLFNNMFAKKLYGYLLITSRNIKMDKDKGYEYLEEITKYDKEKEFSIILGDLYLNEVDTKYYSRGIELLEESMQFNTENYGYLGSLYLEGKKVKQDIEKGLNYLKIAINNKDIKALKYLAFAYSNGEILNNDSNKSIFYFHQAYLLGDENSRDILINKLIKMEHFDTRVMKSELVELIYKWKDRINSVQVYYLIELIRGRIFTRNTNKAIMLYEKIENDLEERLKVYFAFALSKDDSIEFSDKGIELLKKYSTLSNFSFVYYQIALIEKLDQQEEKEKNNNETKVEYEKIASSLRKINDEENLLLNITLAKLIILGKIKEQFDKEGMKLYLDTIDKYGDEYYIRLVQLLIDNNKIDELSYLIPVLSTKNTLLTKRLLANIYLVKDLRLYSPIKAEEIFKENLDLCDSELLTRYGSELLERSNFQADEIKAKELLVKASSLGNQRATYELLMFSIENCDNDIYSEIEKSDLNQDEKIELFYRLASISSVIDEINNSMKYIKEAAKNGNVEAKIIIANEYVTGQLMEQNIELGISTLELLGNTENRALIDLAEYYINGIWIQKNLQKALLILEKNSLKGINYVYHLKGLIYSDKDFENKSKAKAKKNVIKASKESNTYRFRYGVLMKKGGIFKNSDRVYGLKLIEEFKDDMYSDYFSQFGVIAYELEDIEISNYFFTKAMNHPYVLEFRKPTINLFYLYRMHKDSIDDLKIDMDKFIEFIKNKRTCINLFNHMLYLLKFEPEKYNWDYFDQEVSNLSNAIESINWWGKLLLNSKSDKEISEASLVISLLKKNGKIKNSQFHKSWKEYLDIAIKCGLVCETLLPYGLI